MHTHTCTHTHAHTHTKVNNLHVYTYTIIYIDICTFSQWHVYIIHTVSLMIYDKDFELCPEVNEKHVLW